jgi:hypothetical protein
MVPGENELSAGHFGELATWPVYNRHAVYSREYLVRTSARSAKSRNSSQGVMIDSAGCRPGMPGGDPVLKCDC